MRKSNGISLKFLVDREGNVVKRFAPQKKPVQIEREIEKLL
ncbi:hypothetical protein W893_11655 [Staphylococcus aureus subsp. aureus ST 1413]|nr:hypothetical protein W893_11655 [Staphylococcus aureus subsp. aureus ST 1413]